MNNYHEITLEETISFLQNHDILTDDIKAHTLAYLSELQERRQNDIDNVNIELAKENARLRKELKAN